MAQIKVGPGLINPKSINVFKNGQWVMKRKGKVFHNGLWKDFIQYGTYLYNDGANLVTFALEQPAKDYYTFTVQDFPTYKRIFGASTGGTSGYGYLRTNSAVNLTPYSKLRMQLGTVTGQSTTHRGYLSVSVNPSTNRVGSTAITTINYTDSGRLIDLDVSSLSGNFYIRVMTEGTDSAGISMEVKSIWLE